MLHRLYRPKTDGRHQTIWLTIYADLITNLMLLFLALFGLTIMGDDALAKAIQSMKFQNMVFSPDDLNVEANLVTSLRVKLEDLKDVSVVNEVGSVRIEFGEDVIFESGRAVPKKQAKEALLAVADVLKALPHTIVVEGHTDNMPLRSGGRFKNNWELSLARSMSVVEVLIDEIGLPPHKVAAAPYGESRPRASNLTRTGRRMNRRVAIAIFQDFPDPRSQAKPEFVTPGSVNSQGPKEGL